MADLFDHDSRNLRSHIWRKKKIEPCFSLLSEFPSLRSVFVAHEAFSSIKMCDWQRGRRLLRGAVAGPFLHTHTSGRKTNCRIRS